MKKIQRSHSNNTRRYTLINYFDTYWDGEDWVVNNQCIEFDDLYITDDVTNKEILTYLFERGYLTTNDMRRVVIDDYSDGFEIYQRKKMRPLFAIIPTIICN